MPVLEDEPMDRHRSLALRDVSAHACTHHSAHIQCTCMLYSYSNINLYVHLYIDWYSWIERYTTCRIPLEVLTPLERLIIAWIVEEAVHPHFMRCCKIWIWSIVPTQTLNPLRNDPLIWIVHSKSCRV
jgi:hypothetical protein